MQDIISISHVLLSAGIFYACFCRLVKTDGETSLLLRLSVFLEGVAALSLIFAAGIWGFAPSIWTCTILASTLFYLFVTRAMWNPRLITDVIRSKVSINEINKCLNARVFP